MTKVRKWTIEIIKRRTGFESFEILPRRWVVERTLASLKRNRRLAQDFERAKKIATVWIYLPSAAHHSENGKAQ